MLKNVLYFFAGTGLTTLVFAPRLYGQMRTTSERIKKRLNEMIGLIKAQVENGSTHVPHPVAASPKI